MAQRSKWQSLPTEAINPSSVGLDKLSPVDLVDLMHNEDRKVLVAVQRERERLAVGIEMIASALRRGGRIVFVGAGTSGRLGILESAEMPPTFSTDPLLVQAVMAGGRDAIFGAKEGVEDNYEEGARAMTRFHPDAGRRRHRRVGQRHDAVRPRGADPRPQGRLAHHLRHLRSRPPSCRRSWISPSRPAVGAEVIAGSTRLKAGTATKLVLNTLTTGAMVRIGKTYGNLMVDVHTGSEKLKDRARRIVNIVTGLDYEESDRLLDEGHWNVKAAIVMQKTGLPLSKSLARLRKAHDSMREAIGEDIEPRLRGMLQGHAEAAASIDRGLGAAAGGDVPRPAPAARPK